MRLPALRCAFVVLVCALACASASAADPSAVSPVPAFGVTSHPTWDFASETERNADFDKVAAAGIGWIRIDFCWCQFEAGGRGVHNAQYVALTDRIVDAARARGLKVLGILWGTPPWANGHTGLNGPPTDNADYAADARWVSEHFRGRVSAWEVWNEPNIRPFWTGTPAQYVGLLQAAYPAFKAGDPDASVVFAGLSLNDDGWLAQAYAAGAHGYFDVMATHPYQGVQSAAPETADDGHPWWLNHLPAIRQLMVANGDGGKNVWFTEFGWSSYAGGVTQEQQGDYLVRTIKLVRARYPYVTHMFWYDDRNTVSGDGWEDNLGLLNRDLSEKPAYAALKAYLANPTLPDPPASPAPPPPPPPVAPPPPPPPSSTATPPTPPRRAIAGSAHARARALRARPRRHLLARRSGR